MSGPGFGFRHGPGPGAKLQASSAKPREKIPRFKRQAASFKLQAASDKLHNLRALIKFRATSGKVLDQDKTILWM